MSANCFTAFAFAPVIDPNKPPADASYVGNEFFPIGFTLTEFIEFLWTTRYVDVSGSGGANDGDGNSIALSSGVVGGPVQANDPASNRENLAAGTRWDIHCPAVNSGTSAGGDVYVTLIATIGDSGANQPGTWMYDPSTDLYYPAVHIYGFLTDGAGGGVVLTSLVDTHGDYAFTSSASFLGKTVPIRYETSGSGYFGGIDVTKNADWPAT